MFPVSAVLLRLLAEYSEVLRSYSGQLLEFIEWRPTPSGNIEVLNETADYYRYFDATPHAEFLYRCVQETVQRDLPDEVAYLEAYEREHIEELFAECFAALRDHGDDHGLGTAAPGGRKRPQVV